MGKEESAQVVTRRTTISFSSSTQKSRNPQPMTLNDLVFGDEPISFDDLISSLPGRRSQILELVHLLGPLNSPTIPPSVYMWSHFNGEDKCSSSNF